MNPRLVKVSKEVSYALRHAPWEYELELDEEGFVPVEQLLFAINENRRKDDLVTRQDLEQIIVESDKQRHEIVDDKIRALYGHSVPQKVLQKASEPPAVLYHGTTHKAVKSILKEGLKPMGRQYVHLSCDTETAQAVGLRRDTNPLILIIDAQAASAAGHAFYQSNDKVWLADEVPPEYITTE